MRNGARRERECAPKERFVRILVLLSVLLAVAMSVAANDGLSSVLAVQLLLLLLVSIPILHDSSRRRVGSRSRRFFIFDCIQLNE